MVYRLLVVMLLIVSVFLCAERDASSEQSDGNQTEQVARLNIKASFITTVISGGDGGVFTFDLLQQLRVSRDKRDVVRIEKQLELQLLKLAAMSVSRGLKDGKNVTGEKELVRYLV
ncbi:MAG: hypothetical protein LBU65_03425 [Planctomycetaceae bacterium]|jgi:hypothetical protein|nr:hypothetical protein [Planctomycetaceae bacterium]